MSESDRMRVEVCMLPMCVLGTSQTHCITYIGARIRPLQTDHVPHVTHQQTSMEGGHKEGFVCVFDVSPPIVCTASWAGQLHRWLHTGQHSSSSASLSASSYSPTSFSPSLSASASNTVHDLLAVFPISHEAVARAREGHMH